MTWEEYETALHQRLARRYAEMSKLPCWRDYAVHRIRELDKEIPGFKEMARKAWQVKNE